MIKMQTAVWHCNCNGLEGRIKALEQGLNHIQFATSSTEHKFAGLFSTVLGKLSTIERNIGETKRGIQLLEERQKSTEAEVGTIANNVTALTTNFEDLHNEINSVNVSVDLNKRHYGKVIVSIENFSADLRNVTQMAEKTRTDFQYLNATVRSQDNFKQNLLNNVKQINTHVQINLSKTISSMNATLETYRLSSRSQEQVLNESVTRAIERLTTLRQKVEGLSNTSSARNTDGVVFFRAYMSSKSVDLENYTLVFDKVRRNDQNAYSGTKGVFRVPRSGLYLFTLDVRTSKTQNTVYRMFMDDKVVSKGFGSLKLSTMFYADAGSQVYVKTTKPNHFLGGVESMFSGYLLKPLER